MASLLVSPLVGVVLNKLAAGLWKELSLLGGVKKDVEKLQSTLSTINDVLEDAEHKSISDKALQNWLKKLKDAAYDADDVVDELQTEALRAKARDRLKEKVTDSFSSHNPIVFRHKIALKIKDVFERLQAIAEERTDFHLAPISAPVRARNEETHSVVVTSEVYGRDEDKETIVNYLLNEDMDKILSVIAIVGLGGLGKTTLAQIVYNDERIESHHNAWVCVSDEFDVKVIARKIIQCFRKETNYSHLDLDPLGQLLREILGGKRFILVLDDVWNENPQEWENLKFLLSCGEKGSKIVVTTRSKNVARAMDSILLYGLKGLSADDCWRLFRERAFGSEKEDETPRLIEIGMKIVDKAGGLPLAAKALGSLMGSKTGESEWLAIENSEIWNLPEDEDKILPALRLSYYHLQSHMKKCFVYCSLFPKDHYFSKEKLIRLWLGEGFIQSSSQGSKYFNSLLRRSFFDVVDIHRNERYKMHDMIHDLACSVGKDEFYRIEAHEDEIKVLGNCRHLSVDINMSKSILRFSCETKKLRSLLLLINFKGEISDIAWDTLLQLNCIRLLDLSRSNISMLPSTLWRLKHLQFLNLSGTCIETLPLTISKMYNLSTLILEDCYNLKELPSTLCNLSNLSTLILACCSNLRELPRTLCNISNLSTLDLRGCFQLGELPGGMSKMNSLIHLGLWGCWGLGQMPQGMGLLTNLQTMAMFVVGEEKGCGITELKHLNQISGRLELRNLNKVKSPAEAKEANLKEKKHVKELELRWDTATGEEERGNITTEGEHESIIFENLHLPPYLEALRIEDYHGARLPGWMMTSGSSSSETMSSVSLLFQNLVSLELSGLKRCEGLPTLGHLPLLKELDIRGMDGVRRVGGEEFYGHTEVAGTSLFPKLKVLYLREMPNLEEWVVEAGEIPREAMFPSLKKLEIEDCPKLRVVGLGLPMSLVDLQVSGRTELSAGCFAGLSGLRDLDISMPAALLAEGGLRYLTALKRLEIDDVLDGHTTTCLPDGMVECHIPSLSSLDLKYLRSLTSLGPPERTQPPPLFTSLEELVLHGCEALTVLPEWIGCLTSLHAFEIIYCRKLEMLPDGLQHLTALQQLTIQGCPLLQERCVRETGEDWHKIAHIPDIRFEGRLQLPRR